MSFNIAHSGNLCVYAITLNQSIGIDLERVRDVDNGGLVEKFFSLGELCSYMNLPESQKRLAFYHMWVQKEAFVKATGYGFRIPFSHFTVYCQDKVGLLDIKIPKLNMNWYFRELEYFFNYKCVIASNKNIHAIQILTANTLF